MLIKLQEFQNLPPKNNSEANEEEILREKYVSPEFLIQNLKNNWWLKIKGRNFFKNLRLKEENFQQVKIKGRTLI